jgi:hypothetical protein
MTLVPMTNADIAANMAVDSARKNEKQRTGNTERTTEAKNVLNNNKPTTNRLGFTVLLVAFFMGTRTLLLMCTTTTTYSLFSTERTSSMGGNKTLKRQKVLWKGS